MLTAVQRRLQGQKAEGGFTLIELMVVVLIIAILIAIAIPTFLGARQRAQDRAAQSNLRNALTAEKTYYTDHQAYTETASDLTAIEPSLTYDAVKDTSPTQGSIGYVLVSGAIVLASKSASGTCFYIKDDPSNAGTGTKYGKGACAQPSTVAIALTNW